MKNSSGNIIVSHSWQSSLYNNSRNDHSGAAMDNLTYRYATDAKGNILNNRLLHVNDAVVNNATTTDIRNQGNYAQQRPSTHNYDYDEIGNLIKDKSEQIAEIRWTVTGKVSDVIRTAGSQKPDLHFAYDAMGQRIAKTVTNKNTTDGTDKFVTTYYVRDPQGNVLAVYERKRGETGDGTLTLVEQHLYGASRIGMAKPNLELSGGNSSERTAPASHYELSNHLSNVLSVITPDASDATQPAIESLTDYYPFGMEEPGRSYNSNTSRFGYTGHEKENDVAEGVYTTQYRLLDTRLGRWMSVDPLFAKYPDMSSYNYCGGNPMVLVDSDGRGMNGGITFVNNSKETIYLGNASGQKQNGKEVNMNGLVELTPGAKLEPMVLLEKGKETEGVVWAAKLTTIERDENGNEVKNEDGTPKTKVRYIYAYDVDYIQLQEGQTLILKNKLRFNTNEKDKDAKTPVSTWTEKLYNSDDPSHRDHTKYGDLKVRRALTGGGTITFTDGDKSGEIKCDTDNGKGTGSNRINFSEPCIYPEKHTLPHNSSGNEKDTR